METRVILRWIDSNEIEKGFRIYKSSSSIPIDNLPEPVETLSVNSTEYFDYDVIDGNTYYYRVGAFIDDFEEVSDEVSVVATASTIEVNDIFADGSAIGTFNYENNLSDVDNSHSVLYDNGYSFSSGVFGNAIESSGDASNVEYSISYNGTDSVSLSFWVYLTGYRRANIVNFDTYNFGTWLEDDGTLFLNGGSFNDNPMSLAETGITTNEWFHIAISFDGNIGKYFINNSLIQDLSMSVGSGNLNILGDVRTGNYSDQCLTAGSKIDQLRVFNKALNDVEIETLYNES